MRKLCLFIATCTALVAFVGFGGQAFAANPDPWCNDRGNPREVLDFNVSTASIQARAISNLTASGHVCGTDNGAANLPGSLYNHGHVLLPPGVEVGNSNSVSIGSLGSTGVSNGGVCNQLIWWTCTFLSNQGSIGRTDSITGECDRERNNVRAVDRIQGLPTPTGDIISCINSEGSGGENWSWITREPVSNPSDPYYPQKLWLTVGEIDAVLPGYSGFTFISVTLCDYFGTQSATDCSGGQTSIPQWKNGNASNGEGGCINGTGPKGLFKITATMRSGFRTPEVTKCVRWEGGDPPPTVSFISGGGPNPRDNDPTPTFAFRSDQGNSTFKCWLDGTLYDGNAQGCNATGGTPTNGNFTSPITLPDGRHTFCIKARNQNGESLTAKCWQPPNEDGWIVDTVPPEGVIDSGQVPNGERNPTFRFHAEPPPTSGEAAATFRCRLLYNGGTSSPGHDWRSCAPSGTPYASLPVGGYTFRIETKDEAGNSDTTPDSRDTRSWTVVGNQPPTCDNFSQDIPHNPPNTTGSDIDLRRYCRDPDAGQTETLTYSFVSGPFNGSTRPLDPTPAGMVRYTPNSGFQGSDWFTFKACDVNGACSNDGGQPAARASLTVQGPDNNPPTCSNISPTRGGFGIQQRFRVPCDDLDPGDNPDNLTYEKVRDAPPEVGTISIVRGPGTTGGQVTYIPANGYSGTFTFTYRACDDGSPSLCSNGGGRPAATATVTVNDPPDCPANINKTVPRGQSVVIDLTCTDPDGPDQLRYSLVGPAPTNGTLNPPLTTPTTSSQVTYIHNGGPSNLDSFQYKARDGLDDSNPATTVQITVQDAPPIIEPDCDSGQPGGGDGPFNNDFAVNGFNVGTTSPNAGEESEMTIEGVLCGTEIRANPNNCGTSGLIQPQGRETLNDHADIVYPPGVDVNTTNGYPQADPPTNYGDKIAIGSLVGRAQINVALCKQDREAEIEENLFAYIRVGAWGLCFTERGTALAGTPVIGFIPACYKVVIPGARDSYFYAWVNNPNPDPSLGRNTLTIGPYHGLLPGNVGVDGGITNIKEFTFCTRAGIPGATTCPDDNDTSRPWVQKNGDRSSPGCPGGNGIYQIKVTNKGDRNALPPIPPRVTDPVEDCVRWQQDIKADQHCVDVYNNEPGIEEFDLRTDDPREHAVSRVYGGGYFCGSYLGPNPGNGDNTLSNHADIALPPGVDVANSDNVPAYTYAGKAWANVLFRPLDSNNNPAPPVFMGGETRPEQVPSTIYTAPKQQCTERRRDEIVGSTPREEIVLCLLGITAAGSNYNWATKVSTSPDRYVLTIGPMFSEYDNTVRRTKIGLTYIDMELCGYFGNQFPGASCGTGGQSLMRNGDAAAPDCNGGAGPEGLHTIVATMWGGAVPPSATACIPWTEAPDTTITEHPESVTTNPVAIFRFIGTSDSDLFFCSRDGGNESQCNGDDQPGGIQIYANLEPGEHRFCVTAQNASGTRDETPACYTWTIVQSLTDPECDGTPYNNDFRTRRFVAAVQPGGEREYSTLTTSGVICGTAIGRYTGGIGPYGWQTLTSRLDLKLAPQEIIAPVASTDPSYVPNDAYAGSISGRMAIGNASGTSISPFQAKLKVVRPPSGDCPRESRLVACFKAEIVEPNDKMSGYFYVWAMNGLDLGDWYRQTLMVGRLRNSDTPPYPGGPLIGAGLTAFDLTVCRYGGTANASACPSTPLPGISEGWLHRNGVRCSRLTAQARNWFARISPAVETLEVGTEGGPNQLCPTKIGAIIKQSHWPDWGSNRPRTSGR